MEILGFTARRSVSQSGIRLGMKYRIKFMRAFNVILDEFRNQVDNRKCIQSSQCVMCDVYNYIIDPVYSCVFDQVYIEVLKQVIKLSLK